MLDWHRRYCTVCQGMLKCGEYLEIIDEYGAGPYGAAVFYPEEMCVAEEPAETRGGEGPSDWQVSGSAAANATAIREQLIALESYLQQWQDSHGD